LVASAYTLSLFRKSKKSVTSSNETQVETAVKDISEDKVVNKSVDEVLTNKIYVKFDSAGKYTLIEEPMDPTALKALKLAYITPGTKQLRRLMPRQLTGLLSKIYGKLKSLKDYKKTKKHIDSLLLIHGYKWDKKSQKYITENQDKVNVSKAIGIDPSEWVVPEKGFESFEEFFEKRLKEGARPIAGGENIIVSPADCKLMVVENIGSNTTFFNVKHKSFTLEKFLDNKGLAAKYDGGTLLICRLSPYNYHHFHFPVDCYPGVPEVISGGFESVDPIAYKTGIMPLTINIRHRFTLKTKNFGEILMIAVGAYNVGSIVETFATKVKPKGAIKKIASKLKVDTFELKDKDRLYKKGEEAGYFMYGGSTTTLVFKKGTIKVYPEFLDHSSEGHETSIKMGEAFGELIKA
jgi:phosphatidylserine decarboxylase